MTSQSTRIPAAIATFLLIAAPLAAMPVGADHDNPEDPPSHSLTVMQDLVAIKDRNVVEGDDQYGFDITVTNALSPVPIAVVEIKSPDSDLLFTSGSHDGDAWTGVQDENDPTIFRFTANSHDEWLVLDPMQPKSVVLKLEADVKLTADGKKFLIEVVGKPDASVPTDLSETLPLPPTDSFTITVETPPSIQSAKTLDLAGDGKIDAYEILYDKNLAPSGFSASEWSVTGYSNIAQDEDLSSGNKLVITFEGGTNSGDVPDLGYAGSGIKGFYGTLAESPDSATLESGRARDGAAPVVLSASTRDSNLDGSLDAYHVRFSENIAAGVTKGGWAVQSNTLIGVTDTTEGDDELVLLFDGANLGLGTGSLPQLQYSAQSGSIQDLAPTPNPLANIGEGNIVEQDGAAPLALSVTTGDTNADGSIDQIIIVFSEALENELGSNDFEVGEVGDDYTISEVANDGANLVLTLVEKGNYDSDKEPTVSYVGADDLTDAAGNVLANTIPDTTDGAAPVLLHAFILTGTDQLKAIFSEGVYANDDATGDLTADAFEFVDGGDVTEDQAINGVKHSAGDNVVVLTADTVFADSDVDDQDTLAAIAVFDAAGNQAAVEAKAVEAKALTFSASTIGAGDGYLGAIHVRFNLDVDPGTIGPAPEADWTVDGYDVETAQLDSTDLQLLVLTLQRQDGTEPDTGATPTVTYDGDSLMDDDGEVTLVSGTSVDAADGADIVFLSAKTVDTGANGELDEIHVLFSEPLDSDTLADAAWSIDDVDVADGNIALEPTEQRRIIITLPSESGYGTGDEPVVKYDANSGGLEAADGSAVSAIDGPAEDNANPILLSVTGNPGDSSILLTFSERVAGVGAGNEILLADLAYEDNLVDDSASGMSHWALGTTWPTNTAVLILDEPLVFADLDASTPDKLSVLDGVHDTAGLSSVAQEPLPFTDITSPTIVSATTMDVDGDGRIDAIRVLFSEDIDEATFNGNGWSLGGAYGGDDMADLEVLFGGGTNSDTQHVYDNEGPRVIHLTFAELDDVDTGETPSVSFDSATGVAEDRSGNNLPNLGDKAVDDGAAPVAIAAFSVDDDDVTDGIHLGQGDGYLDGYVVVFSEDIARSAGGWDVVGYPGAEVDLDADVPAHHVFVRFESGSVPDTGELPAISYAAGGITDLEGNPALDFEPDFLTSVAGTLVDYAAPVLVQVLGQPGDTEVTAIFSEPVHNGDNQAIVLEAFSYADDNADGAEAITGITHTANTDQATLTLDSELSASDMETGQVSAVTGRVYAVRQHQVSPIPVFFADLVAPTVTHVKTSDVDGDGYIDRIFVVFNEPMSDSSFDHEEFTVQDYEIESGSVSGKVISLVLTEGASLDTHVVPLVTFIGEETLTDLAQNDWDGFLGLDAAGEPSSSAVATDGARPAIVEALVTPNSPFIDVRFSEPVIDAEGNALGDVAAFQYLVNSQAVDLTDFEHIDDLRVRLTAIENIDLDEGEVAAVADTIFDTAGLSAPTNPKDLTEYDGPRVETITTRDTDGDGILDAIRVTFDRPIAEALDETAWHVAEPFMIDSVSISGTDNVEIGLETSAPDTASVPAVTYARPSAGALVGDDGAPAASILGLAGTHAECQGATPSKLCTLDGAAPVLVKASANSGSDEVTLHFSEPIDRDLGLLDLLYDDGTGDSWIDDLTKASTGDGEARIQLFDALTKEHLGVHLAGVEAGLPDAAGNVGLGQMVPILDDVRPSIASVKTIDSEPDGRIDALRVVLSEPFDFDSLVADGTDSLQRFSVDGSNDGVDILAVAVSGKEFILGFTESEGAGGDTDRRPILTYDASPESTADTVTDLSGNVLEGYSAPAKDGAPPVALTAKTVGDGTGSLDGYVVKFSEPIELIGSITPGAAQTGWSVGGAPAWDVEQPASGPDELLVIFDGLALDADTGDTPELTYSGSTVKDLSSTPNLLGAISDASGDHDLLEADGARPVITLVDAQEGRKELVVVFSEPVHNGQGGKLSASRFIYGDGDTIKSVSHAGLDRRAVLTLEAAVAGPDIDTKSVRVVQDKVFDNAMPMLAAETTPVTIADWTDPFVVSAETADEDANGRIDQIELVFNEVIVGTPLKGDFVLPDYAVKDLHVSGSTIVLGLHEGVAPDTGARPIVAYGGNHVGDEHGNEWDGFVPEARDGAAPVALSADVIDAAATVVRVTFSEPVSSPGEAGTPPSRFDYDGVDDDKTVIGVSRASSSTFDLTLDTPLSASDQAAGHTDQDKIGFVGLIDASGNEVAGGAIGIIGGPLVQSITTMDTQGQGVDMLEVVFSRAIDDGGLVLGDWSSTLETIASIRTGRLATPETDEEDDNVIYLVLAQSIEDTGARPEITYDGTSIVDASGAALLKFEDRDSLDGVQPRILGIGTWDEPGTSLPPVGDGVLDYLYLVASEPLDMSTLDGEDWSVNGASVTVTGGSFPPPSQVFRFFISNDVGTGVRPVVSYDGTMTDLAGNLLMPLVDFISTDTAPPVLLSATSPGFDSTEVTLVFSEPITGSGAGGALVAADMAYTDVGGGASGIDSIAHSGALATLTLDAGFVEADNRKDTVAAVAAKIKDAAGLEAPSVPVLLSTETKPPAPIADLAVSAVTANSVKLAFTAVADDRNDAASGPATAYLVRYSEAPITTEAQWDTATEVSITKSPGAPGSAETVTIVGLALQTTYHIAIRAMDEAGNKGDLSAITATTLVDDTPPTGTLTVTSQSHTSGQASAKATATLTWNQLSDPESAVTYHYKVTDQAAYTVEKTDPTTSETTLTRTSLADGTHYVHVAAFSAGGGKQAAPFKLVIDTVAPARIDDLAASDAGPLSITLTWKSPGDNGDSGTASDYQLYWSDEAFNANNLADIALATGVAAPAVAGTAQSFQVTGLTPDTEYHFAIRARDAAGNKGPLSSILATATDPDTTPPIGALDLRSTTHDADVTSNRRDVKFSWTAASDPETDVVYRYALTEGAHVLSDADSTTVETSVEFADVEPGQWVFRVAAESAGGRASTESFNVVILGITDSDIEAANKQVITKVTRQGAYNVIDWTLPANTPADVQGVQVLRSNSPFQVISTIAAGSAAFESGRFVDDSQDSRATSRYLVTMYYGNGESLGKQPEGQDLQVSEPLNSIGVAPSSDSLGIYARPAFYVALLGVIAIVGLAITGIVRFSQRRQGDEAA